MDSGRKPFTFDRVVRLAISIAVIGAALWLVDYLKGVLLPFVIACLAAYLINPAVEWNKKLLRMKTRAFPTILTLCELVVVIGGALWLLVPYIYGEAHDTVLMVSDYMESKMNVPFLPPVVHDFIKDNIDLDYLQSLLTRDEWVNLFKRTAEGTWSVVGGTLSVILALCSWVLALLYVIFISIDYDRITAGFKRAIPRKYRRITFRVFNDVKESMNRYFRGQALIALIVGILFSIGFTIIGLPMGIALGIFVGVLNLVPYLQVLSFPIAAMLCLVDSVSTGGSFWELAGWTVLVYLAVQAIQDLILTPKIMGKTMGLNPAIILLSLSVWGALLGFVGLIVALPLTTLLIAYYNEYVIKRYDMRHRRRRKKPAKSAPEAAGKTEKDEKV